MDIRNCPKCGKVFTYTGSIVCSACEKQDEKDFQTVKEFIRDNPSCIMKDIVEATGVTSKKIMRYVRDGRLEISKGMHGDVLCQSCGTPISRGKFCDSCVIKINTDVESAFKPSKPKPSIDLKADNKNILMQAGKRIL